MLYRSQVNVKLENIAKIWYNYRSSKLYRLSYNYGNNNNKGEFNMKKEERKFEDVLKNMGETLAMLFGVIAILIIALNAARQHDNKEAAKEETYVPQNQFDALVHDYEMNHPDATIKDEIDYLREVYHTDSSNELQTFMIEVTKCDLQEVAQDAEVVEMIQLTNERFKPIVSWNYNYTPEEVILLGDLMYAEEMQYTDDPDGELVLKAAGSAVLHRVAECQGYFPNTIYDVIHDGEGTRSQQYATATLNKLGNIDTPEKVYQTCLKMVLLDRQT